jgi:hypothetical protein
LKMFVNVFEDISKFDMSKIESNLESFVTIFSMFALLMLSSHFAGANAAKGGAGVLAMSGALILVVAAIKMIDDIEPSTLERAIEMISKLMLVFAAVVAASFFAGENASRAGTMLLKMSGALLILTGAISILSLLDPSGLKRATEAVTKLMSVFAVLIAASGIAKNAKSTITAISVTVGILAISLATLSLINPNSLESATKALSMVMALFAGIVASTALAKNATTTIVLIAGVVAVLGGVLYLLADLPVDSTLTVAEGLSVLLLAFSASLITISQAKTISSKAYISLGVMTLVVSALGGILVALSQFDVDSVLGIAAGLSVVLLSLSGSLLILSGVGTLGAAASKGLSTLAILVAGVTAFAVAVAGLAELIPGLEDFLNRGLGVLEAVGYGIGSFLGNIVGGFAAGVTSGLSDIGTNLSNFMNNASGFFDGIKKLDDTAVTGVKNLAEIALLLAGADLVRAIDSFLFGDSLDEFSTQLKSFGNAMVSFSQTVSGNIDESAVTAAANAGSMLTSLADSIPKSGGAWQSMFGEQDLEKFSTQLKSFGNAMVSFSQTVSGNIDESAVTAAANAGSMLTSLADSIPKSGGVSAIFAGDNDMSDFGRQLTDFANCLVEFSNQVSGIDISGACSQLEYLINTIESMSLIDGNSVSGFREALGNLGTEGINAFVSSINNAGPKVSSAASTMLTVFINAVNAKKTSVNAAFTKIITSTLTTIKKQNNSFRQAGEALVSALASGMRSKSSSVTTALGSSLGSAVSGIRAHWSSFYSAGSYLGQGVVSGINASAASVYRAGYNLGQQAVRGEMDGQQSRSPSRLGIKAGKYLGEGVVIGIGKMVSSVYDSGYDLGDTAVNSLSEAISRIAEFVDSDVDCQPTIRPVLDLSEIQNGTQQLDQMLGERSTMLAYRIGTVKSREQVMQEAADKMTRAVSSLSYGRADTEETPTGENYTITVPLYLEGREVARATAPFINDRQNQLRNRDLRNRGKVK